VPPGRSPHLRVHAVNIYVRDQDLSLRFYMDQLGFDLAFDVENLLDQAFRSAQFATTSRLASEPAVGTPIPTGFSCGRNGRLAPGAASGIFYGCQDVDYTPAYPLTLRLFVTLFLD